MDPIVTALAGAIVTIAGVLFRELVKARYEAKADALFWRNKALENYGLAEIATDVAEKRSVR